MIVVRLDQILRRNFDPEVHHRIAVIRQNNLDQIFADVVDVALHRRENDLAARRRIGLLHELLQVAYGRLHRFGGLQHLRHDQLIVVEQPADLVHPRHQRAVDHIEWRRALGELAVEIGDEAILAALDDVVREAFVERNVGGVLLFLFHRVTKMRGDRGDVELIDRDLLVARLFAPVFR